MAFFQLLRKPLTLAGFTLASTTVVLLTFLATKHPIENSRRLALENRLSSVLAEAQYDNDLNTDFIKVTDPLLGSDTPQTIWRARLQQEPVAAVISSTAPNGYNGPIHLLVGINRDGQLTAVRVVTHTETPGLGDDIEITRSEWINGFSAKSLENLETALWAVKKDGGVFDQFTGATITPRAVISAIHSTLTFYRANKTAIFTNESVTTYP